ncbi:type II toxin-antitoxin system VapC family toxin [Phyllobacterium sp. SB3]|uniref:type II toxin-antitoxin system VapC family toxin n=1 Tax=Phyllobacterium sp. SB3 TaxID=3156073 RepID=UPI0032AE8D94
MFIDTSVIVAILSKEEDADFFAQAIESAKVRTTSTLVFLEAAMRLSTKLSADPTIIAGLLQDFFDEAEITIVPIDGSMAVAAVKAFSEYGKGRGHPAQLNLADCLSYASAKVAGVPLLYKGADFAQTDLT